MKFRVDDVVHCKTDGELRLTGWVADLQDWTAVRLCEARYNEAVMAGIEDCTLLRRPVQVGDKLIVNGGEKLLERITVARISGGMLHDGGYGSISVELAVRHGWTHADGTPIDPPQPRVGSEPESLKALKEFRATLPPLPENTELDEQRLARLFQPELDAANQRANHLADENGILRDENTRLKVENSDLRREIARMGRKR